MKSFPTAALAALGLLLAQTAAANIVAPRGPTGPLKLKTVMIGCDAPQGHRCFFAVFSATGAPGRKFVIDAGGRNSLPGVIPRSDRFIVVVDTPTPPRPDCNLVLSTGKFCKVAVIQPDFNH